MKERFIQLQELKRLPHFLSQPSLKWRAPLAGILLLGAAGSCKFGSNVLAEAIRDASSAPGNSLTMNLSRVSYVGVISKSVEGSNPPGTGFSLGQGDEERIGAGCAVSGDFKANSEASFDSDPKTALIGKVTTQARIEFPFPDGGSVFCSRSEREVEEWIERIRENNRHSGIRTDKINVPGEKQPGAVDPTPSPLPAPTATKGPTPSPSPTPSRTPGPEPEPTHTPSPTASPSPSETAEPTHTPSATSTPQPAFTTFQMVSGEMRWVEPGCVGSGDAWVNSVEVSDERQETALVFDVVQGVWVETPFGASFFCTSDPVLRWQLLLDEMNKKINEGFLQVDAIQVPGGSQKVAAATSW